MEEPGGLQSMGSLRVGHDWATSLSLFTFMHWRRKWQPTPVFLPGESQRWGAWWAAIYGSHRVGHDWSHLQQQRMGLDAWSSFFECWVLCQLFHSPLSLSLRGSLVSAPGGISYSPFCLFSTMRGHILTMWFNNRLLRYILYFFPSYIYIYILTYLFFSSLILSSATSNLMLSPETGFLNSVTVIWKF